MPSISLSDRFFLPVFALACIGLIYLALEYRPLGNDPVLTETQLIYEGASLSQLVPGPGTSSTFEPATPGRPTARATATASIEAAGRMSAGVGAIVPPEFESAVLGREIELAITLRAEDPEHTEVAIGYFVVGRGDSGWRERTIPADGSPLILRHSIPENAPTGNFDWIGVWPDLRGAGRFVVIERLVVTILPEEDAGDATSPE